MALQRPKPSSNMGHTTELSNFGEGRMLLRPRVRPLRQWQCQERTLFVNGGNINVEQSSSCFLHVCSALLCGTLNYIMRALETSRREKRWVKGRNETRVRRRRRTTFQAESDLVRMGQFFNGYLDQLIFCDVEKEIFWDRTS